MSGKRKTKAAVWRLFIVLLSSIYICLVYDIINETNVGKADDPLMSKTQIKNASKDDNRTLNHKMKLLLDIGQTLMESGADCARIIRDMRRAAAHLRIPGEQIQSHVTYTTLMLNVTDGERSFTQFRKCMKHGVNLAVIEAISKLTWRILRGNTPMNAIENAVQRIWHRPRSYSTVLTALGAAAGSGASCTLFGGSLPETLVAGIAALAGFTAHRLSIKKEFNPYACTMIAAFAATISAWLIPILLGLSTMWYALVSCTIFLVPGFPIINAASDVINRYISSGMTRAIDTMLVIGGMTFGIAFAILSTGIENISDVHIQPTSTYLEQAAAAALASIGFSVIFNTPKKLLALVAFEGIVTMLIRNVLMLEFGLSQAIGSFAAAAVVGISALKVIHIVHTPNTLLIIPPIIPLVPGVLLYRLLFAILHIQTISAEELLEALRFGVSGITIILAIVIGVSIPNIFIQKRIEAQQQREISAIIAQRETEG